MSSNPQINSQNFWSILFGNGEIFSITRTQCSSDPEEVMTPISEWDEQQDNDHQHNQAQLQATESDTETELLAVSG